MPSITSANQKKCSNVASIKIKTNAEWSGIDLTQYFCKRDSASMFTVQHDDGIACFVAARVTVM